MKNQPFLALCGATALIMAACSTSDDVTQALTSPVPAMITAHIGQTTRAYDNTWEAGDKIGLLVSQDANGTPYRDENVNCSYITAAGDGTFAPTEASQTVFYPSNGDDIYIQAYYPYRSALDGTAYVIDSWSDQTQRGLDLLLAEPKTGSMAEGKQDVQLNFKHQCCKLVLNIAPDLVNSLLTEEDLEGMVITANGMNVKASFDVRTGVLTKGDEVAAPITFATEGDGTKATAYVCPDYHSGTDLRIVTFTLASGRTFTWKIPGTTTFAKGNRYTWSITLVGDGLVEAKLTAVIDDWDDTDMGEINLDIDKQ